MRIFRYSIDDDQEDNLEDRLFPLLLVVVVSFNSPVATGRRWLLRRRVSCTAAVPNSWNLVLQNPQLWILYTLSLETYALIPIVRKKFRLRGYAHKQQKKTKDTRFYVVQQKLTSTKCTRTQFTLWNQWIQQWRTITQLSQFLTSLLGTPHHALILTMKKLYIVSSSPTPTKLRQRCN